MQQYILKENTLTDNLLLVPERGKVFNGQFIAVIKEYKFQNAWSDKEEIKKFRSKNQLIKYLNKNYPEFNQIELN